MLVSLSLLFLSGETRLANLATPVNHFYDFSNEKIDPKEYKFVIFTDPQLGKHDRDHGAGVGNLLIQLYFLSNCDPHIGKIMERYGMRMLIMLKKCASKSPI